MIENRHYRVEAIILKRKDYSEADRLLTVYARERGKMVLLAKGARKLTSRKSGHLELFSVVKLQLAKGRTWDIVTQAETLLYFPLLRRSLPRISHAYYLAELLDGFGEENNSDIRLYTLAKETLGRLNGDDNLLRVSRFFEMRLLSLTGFQPQLYLCRACQAPIEETAANYWSATAGGVLCPTCGAHTHNTVPLSVPQLKLMRYLERHSYQMCRRLEVDNALWRGIEPLMQQYIVSILEHRLRSVEFLQRLRRQAAHEDQSRQS